MSDDEKDLPKWAQDADADTPETVPEDGQGMSGAGGPEPEKQHSGPPPEDDER